MHQPTLLNLRIKNIFSLLTLLFFCSWTPLSAQKVEFGIRSGFHTGNLTPKDKFYKGTWERTNGIAVDIFGRFPLSGHLFVQSGIGYYQRTHTGFSAISSFQGGFELEGQHSICNLQFILGFRTKQENKKLYGFAALGFGYGVPVDRSFDKAIWFKSPVEVRIKGEESSLISEIGLGFGLRKRIKAEISLRYLPTQFITRQKSISALNPDPELTSNWYMNAFCPGITFIFN